MNKSFLYAVGLLLLVCSAGFSQNDSDGIPLPFQDAKIGQWVKHRFYNGGIVRAEIVDISEEGEISVEMEDWRDGKLLDSKTHKHTADQIKADRVTFLPGEVISIEHTVSTVLGEEIPVSIVTRAFGEDYTIKIVFSREIPVYGEVLIEASDQPYPISELIDYKK